MSDASVSPPFRSKAAAAGAGAAAARTRADRLMFVVLIAVGLGAPFLVYPTLLMKVLCFALFASAFNLLLGFAGLLSFGHAAFFGASAYVCGYLCRELGVTPEVGILAGTAFAGVLGVGFGLLAIRRSGIYFAMITLALAALVYFV